jgi:hypothetical protein
MLGSSMFARAARLACGLLVLVGCAAAAAQQPTPPTDMELLQLRLTAAERTSAGAESQIKYLAALLWRAEIDKKATAEWWAAYIGAGKPN